MSWPGLSRSCSPLSSTARGQHAHPPHPGPCLLLSFGRGYHMPWMEGLAFPPAVSGGQVASFLGGKGQPWWLPDPSAGSLLTPNVWTVAEADLGQFCRPALCWFLKPH